MRDPNTRRRLVATIAQFLIVISLFYAALHEEERMQYAQMGVHAQSIERGADLYLDHCAMCHGLDGLGLEGKAPALNNPLLFGHDFFPEVTEQIRDLNHEKSRLIDERNQENMTDIRRSEIDTRIAEIEVSIDDLNVKRSADVQMAVDKGYDPVIFNRIWQLDWNGTLESLLLTTLIHGRPNSSSYWPSAMPAYSQEAFADFMLERYQLEDLTAYMMNWDKGDSWTLEDLYAVKQFPIQAEDPKPYTAQIQLLIMSNDTIPQSVGTDIEAITAALAQLTGDAARGEALYLGQVKSNLGYNLPCTGCHQASVDAVGPMTDGTYSRVINERLKEPQFAGYTPEQYLIESIVLPGNHVVEGFQNAMITNSGEALTTQDLADIIAYLRTENP
ncbi:MAG: c-type cytochrome [Chloroflexi bacterium]|nr:c-type cytochrome [Chloroflexota bacterium]MCC6895781.1 cytochrome c [Anaerolineae bacterium]